MGVPGFFAWLVKKYPDEILQEHLELKYDSLYLDWNGGIHPVCRSILEKYKGTSVSKSEVEDEMISEMLSYLRHVVQYNQPQKLLFIAIDGVAPRAKMNQQRSRRFKSSKDKEIITQIKKKYGQPLDYAWDTNAITPGTIFMRKLCKSLKEHIHTDKFYTNAKFTTILSDAFEPMEGEHKIMSHIRQHPNTKCVIYGLDADLIFLSLLSKNEIFLMRERDQFGDVRGCKPFWYMIVQNLKLKLITEMQCRIHVKFEDLDILNDFVILCFLLGNDFMPKLPCLFIHEGGIDTLLQVHREIVNTTSCTLTSNKEINIKIFAQILTLLAVNEGYRLQNFHKKNQQRFNPAPGASAYEIEILQYDLLWPAQKDNVMMGKKGWKDRYYNHFFDFDRFVDNGKLFALNTNYLEAIQWTWSYYNNGVPSWEWYYHYHHAPVLGDFAHFCSKCRTSSFEFNLSHPVSEDLQLLSVLPPQSFHLIPTDTVHKIQSSQLRKYYPYTFNEDCIHKKKRWQTIPNIPFVNINELKNVFA